MDSCCEQTTEFNQPERETLIKSQPEGDSLIFFCLSLFNDLCPARPDKDVRIRDYNLDNSSVKWKPIGNSNKIIIQFRLIVSWSL